MELMRCMVEVPLILDKAMREDIASASSTSTSTNGSASPQNSSDAQGSNETGQGSSQGSQGQLERRGILGVRTKGMLVLTCRVLEKAERWTGGSTASTSASWDDDDSNGSQSESNTEGGDTETSPPRS